MRFNFRHNQENSACPITWAVTVPVRVSVDPVPLESAPRPLSSKELNALIHELGQEGLLDQQQIQVLRQLPELS
jgi:hypothetical protein